MSDFFDSFCVDQIQSLVLQDDLLYSSLFRHYEDFQDALRHCKNQEAADQLAKEYFLVVTKASRGRFVNDLLEYRVEYSLLIPFYCRMLAIISKH